MSRRITIRLGEEDYGKLQKRRQEATLDLSFVVRDALRKYFADGGTTDREPKAPHAGQVMPAEAFALTPPYRAWSGGDLRTELRKRFLDLLALAHTAAQNWPRTPGIREVYSGLLGLGLHLGIGQDGRHA